MGRLGGPELIVILIIVLLLFGAKKLPELARSLGASMKEFSKAKEEGERSVAQAADSDRQAAEPEGKTGADQGNKA